MKAKRLSGMLLLAFFSLTIHLPNNKTKADQENYEELKAKAESGDAQAQSRLGEMYGAGNGVPKNETESVKWHRKAAQQGVALSQLKLGVAYMAGIAGERNPQKGAAWFLQAAEQGYPDGELFLANLCATGNGLPKDLVEAYKWYRLYSIHTGKEASAADKLSADMTSGELAEAKRRIAEWRPKKFVREPESDAESVKAKAERGDADSQFNLGWMYANGEGVAQDFVEALKWYRKAAEQGHEIAENNLGLAYEAGLGVSKDFVEAVKWYRKAAGQGYARAQCNLANKYYIGQGVGQDSVEAAKWMRRAAEQGFAQAQSNLGNMYEDGRGVPKDYVEAYKWYNLAASQEEPGAAINREALAKSLTFEQIAEAQRLCREFKGPAKAVSDPVVPNKHAR